MTFECSICLEKVLNKRVHFTCSNCGVNICKNCFVDSILNTFNSKFMCPSCYHEIELEKIISLTSKKFFTTEYFNRMTELKYNFCINEQIKIIIPIISKINNRLNCKDYNERNYRALQRINDEIFDRDDSNYPMLELYESKLDELLTEYFKNSDNVCRLFRNNVIIRSIIMNINRRVFDNYLSRHNIVLDNFDLQKELKNLTRIKTQKYEFKCPYEDCVGFLVNYLDNYKCLVCNKVFCKKCLGLLTVNHECKKEDVESMDEIKKHTKPCPKCASRIFKISGCPQMFCVNCHVGFDWETGKIITTNFHNPHRMEYIQKHPDFIQPEQECDYHFSELLDHYNDSEFLKYHFYMSHIKDLLDKNEDVDQEELILLLNYSLPVDKFENLSKIDKVEFKYRLKKLERKRFKNNIQHEIYQNMYDIFNICLTQIDQILISGRDVCNRINEIKVELDSEIKMFELRIDEIIKYFDIYIDEFNSIENLKSYFINLKHVGFKTMDEARIFFKTYTSKPKVEKEFNTSGSPRLYRSLVNKNVVWVKQMRMLTSSDYIDKKFRNSILYNVESSKILTEQQKQYIYSAYSYLQE